MATRREAQTPGDVPMTATEVNERYADGIAAVGSASVEVLQAQIQQLMGAMAQLQANQRTIPSQVQAQALPDIADIDITEVNHGSSPVLTKQGWIVPPSHGADPVLLAEEKAKREERAALMKLAEAAAAKA